MSFAIGILSSFRGIADSKCNLEIHKAKFYCAKARKLSVKESFPKSGANIKGMATGQI